MNTSHSRPAMTHRERLLSALRREPVDYVPCCTAFNPLSEVQRAGKSWNFPWAPDATIQDQLQYQTDVLGLDPVVNLWPSAGRPTRDTESTVRVEGGVLHKTYHTPVGELHAAVRYDELWPHGRDIPFYSDFNVGHFIEPWIQNEADLACFTHIIHPCDRSDALTATRAEVARARALADQFQIATLAHVGMGLTGAQHLFGATQLCMLTLDQPDLVDAYLEHEHQINRRTIELLGEGGIDIIRRNGFYETADFYSPAMLEPFVGQRIRREAQETRAAGMLGSYTVHTGIAPLLDYLAGLGVDSFFGVDIAFKNLDLEAVKQTLCAAHSIWTGPSSAYHLWQSPQATRAAVRQVFDVFGTTGLILSPCVSVHSIMPWENADAMFDEWRRLARP